MPFPTLFENSPIIVNIIIYMSCPRIARSKHLYSYLSVTLENGGSGSPQSLSTDDVACHVHFSIHETPLFQRARLYVIVTWQKGMMSHNMFISSLLTITNYPNQPIIKISITSRFNFNAQMQTLKNFEWKKTEHFNA